MGNIYLKHLCPNLCPKTFILPFLVFKEKEATPDWKWGDMVGDGMNHQMYPFSAGIPLQTGLEEGQDYWAPEKCKHQSCAQINSGKTNLNREENYPSPIALVKSEMNESCKSTDGPSGGKPLQVNMKRGVTPRTRVSLYFTISIYYLPLPCKNNPWLTI
jgi:hypothetical protein